MIRWLCLLIKMTLLAILIVVVSPTPTTAPSNVTTESGRTPLPTPSAWPSNVTVESGRRDTISRQPARVSTSAQVLFIINVAAVPVVLISFLACCIFNICRRVKNIDHFRSYKEHHLKPVDWDPDQHPEVPQIDAYFERKWCRLHWFAKKKK